MNEQTNARPIPPLPGGGSWRFDESAWSWIATDLAAQAPAEQPAAADHATTEE